MNGSRLIGAVAAIVTVRPEARRATKYGFRRPQLLQYRRAVMMLPGTHIVLSLRWMTPGPFQRGSIAFDRAWRTILGFQGRKSFYPVPAQSWKSLRCLWRDARCRHL